MVSILKSRQLWTFVAAQIVAIATLAVTHYVKDEFAFEMAKLIIGTAEGVGVILITAFTVEDTIARTYAKIMGIKLGVDWRNFINKTK